MHINVNAFGCNFEQRAFKQHVVICFIMATQRTSIQVMQSGPYSVLCIEFAPKGAMNEVTQCRWEPFVFKSVS